MRIEDRGVQAPVEQLPHSLQACRDSSIWIQAQKRSQGPPKVPTLSVGHIHLHTRARIRPVIGSGIEFRCFNPTKHCKFIPPAFFLGFFTVCQLVAYLVKGWKDAF